MHAARCTALRICCNCLKKYLLNLSLAQATTINTPLSEVLKLRKGVCQDFTHFASLRSMGEAWPGYKELTN
jgi:hypothetical protein